MVLHSYAQYHHVSVRNSLSFGFEKLNMLPAKINQRIDQACGVPKIEELMKRNPRSVTWLLASMSAVMKREIPKSDIY